MRPTLFLLLSIIIFSCSNEKKLNQYALEEIENKNQFDSLLLVLDTKLENKDFENFVIVYTDAIIKSKDFIDQDKVQLRIDRYEEYQKNIAIKNGTYKGSWSSGSFTDEFGDKTSKSFIEISGKGSFSNSETNNSDLFFSLLLDGKNANLKLKEYRRNSQPVKPIKPFTIKIKNKKGKIVKITSASSWNDNGGVLISNRDYNPDYNKLINLLKKEGELRFVVFDGYSTNYSFSFDATGFNNSYSAFK